MIREKKEWREQEGAKKKRLVRDAVRKVNGSSKEQI